VDTDPYSSYTSPTIKYVSAPQPKPAKTHVALTYLMVGEVYMQEGAGDGSPLLGALGSSS